MNLFKDFKIKTKKIYSPDIARTNKFILAITIEERDRVIKEVRDYFNSKLLHSLEDIPVGSKIYVTTDKLTFPKQYFKKIVGERYNLTTTRVKSDASIQLIDIDEDLFTDIIYSTFEISKVANSTKKINNKIYEEYSYGDGTNVEYITESEDFLKLDKAYNLIKKNKFINCQSVDLSLNEYIPEESINSLLDMSNSKLVSTQKLLVNLLLSYSLNSNKDLIYLLLRNLTKSMYFSSVEYEYMYGKLCKTCEEYNRHKDGLPLITMLYINNLNNKIFQELFNKEIKEEIPSTDKTYKIIYE